ncbi:E3 ubiquitin-protein ligase NEDD4 [Cenococcum geophilum 1.58]|uniref:E3 ubiquitin-protein ligase NEDD4 n=1 Tax=Cenococcum geophilum 1.58 TaxID=794803 RepID=UPI00358F80BA|nr:E3 ubiquitin-protein ligase NEDD4 [Cenococcum geophilum 1.58]
MFSTFSGSSRRPRQVNLSGRHSSPHTTVGSGAGSQAALDRAHQERLQRQRERDRLGAAKTIQRTWRGHACRKRVQNRLRHEWDAVEQVSAGQHTSNTPTPYASGAESLRQLQYLLRFAQMRTEEDIRRIKHYGYRQILTTQNEGINCSSGSWPLAYLRLQRLVLPILEHRLRSRNCDWSSCNVLMVILNFLAGQIPTETAQNAKQFYRTIAMVAQKTSSTWRQPADDLGFPGAGAAPLTLIMETTMSPMKTVTGYTLNAYEAFACTFMVIPVLTQQNNSTSPTPVNSLLNSLADRVNYKLLASALVTLLKTSSFVAYPELVESRNRARLLGCFIYFHRYVHDFHSPQAYSSHKDFVSVVSSLLNSLPNNIIDGQIHDADQTDEISPSYELSINEFVREQIMSLVNQESVGSLLSSSSRTASASGEDKVEEARQLANYALALLRFFPRRGDEIRMWLYLGPTSSSSDGPSKSLPAIKYFWQATKNSSVFNSITRDSRAAINFLKPKGPGTKHGWKTPYSDRDTTSLVEDEWRVILVFLELYTFVLKVTDDEEFFSGGNIDFTRTSPVSSTMTRENALPLGEVKALTTFLKNLGFTLYFNASDIASTEERDSSSASISGFSFSSSARRISELSQPEPKPTEPSVGGVAGLSIDYVKGLVTGLLRMVYERDSRRKFLPTDHWLMTSRFDMGGFIPSVVQEEESRHRIEEEDAEDINKDDDDEDYEASPQLIGTSRTQQARRLERLQRQQRKASRRRYLQAVAPRLEILQNMPFFIPFTTRVQIFREFVTLDMNKRRGHVDADTWRLAMMRRPDAPQQYEKHHAKIRREHEFDDAFEQFYPLGQGLKEPIQITFVDQFDTVEAGIDGGGVTKEFLTSVTHQAFNPSDGIDLFVENDQHLLYANPSAVEEQKELLRLAGIPENSIEFRTQVTELLQRYEFLGRIIGKCLYEGILVDVNFAPFFLRKWALTGGTGSAPKESGYRATLNDLRDLDEGLYQGLHQLKNYTGDVEDFSLNFTVTDTVTIDRHTGATKTITKDLKTNGSNTLVTNQNRLMYISYMARHRLQNQPYLQTTAFLRGLATMIQPSWLSMFNHSELQTLIGGTSSSIDIDDLRRNTQYGGVYVIGDDGLEHPTIQIFWRVMEQLSDGERRAVLKFVTSTPRAPLLGFGTLSPRFSIRDAGSNQERLPSTSTCVNLLKLPMYTDEDVLKEKLLYSVFSGAGFDLS